MAKKTKKTTIENAALEEPTVLSLTEVELLKLKLAETEIRYNNLAANAKLAERNQYLAKIDPENKLGRMESEIRQNLDKASSTKTRYSEVIASIESRVGIKMADYSYDDETGALIPIST